ncbi:unnamed protein product [Candidula unifasciata]|uniref:Sulfatase N-terminal domain-containing protein n=1 Tax=Candidula unifasciata TaxID=100452 RepID=A0A8S3ZWR3_9EUPU|nr:unnamed protein product [Candidula unifasciata]
MMHLKDFLVLCFVCICGLLSLSEGQSGSESKQRPNVLFIVIDDLRPTLGCYGEPLLRTPNVDNLASKSILFDQTFVQQAVCGPSRISFLTSRRPDTTRLYDFYSYWRVHAGNYTTLPQHFKESGYITQSVGKVFHPGIASNRSDDSPYSWTNTPYHPPTQAYKNSKVCPNRDGTLGMNIVCPVDLDEMPEKSLPDIQSSDFAVEFLKNLSQAETNQPFFLAVGFHKPHIPLKYPRAYKNLYPISEIKLAKYHTYPWRMPLVAWNPFIDLRDRDDVKNLNVNFPFGPVPESFQLLMRQSYYAATSYMDAQVGKVLSALETNGFSNNTIVTFIGDHGWSLGEHQTWSKYSLFEVAVRVPFIMYIPGVTYTKTNKDEKVFPYFNILKASKSFSAVKNVEDNSSILFTSEYSTPLHGTTNTNQGKVTALSGKEVAPNWQFEPRYKSSDFVELVDLFPTLAEAAGLPTLPLCPPNPFKTRLCTEGVSLVPLIKNITGSATDTKTGVNVEDRSTLPKSAPKDNSAFLLARNCSDVFIPATSKDFHWKSAVFSQYPRPAAVPQHNTELPHLADIRIMGYSMWTPEFHYTEWVGFNPKNYTIFWDDEYARELYLRSTDPYEINNVAVLERCFPLVEMLSEQLHQGWRGALPK